MKIFSQMRERFAPQAEDREIPAERTVGNPESAGVDGAEIGVSAVWRLRIPRNKRVTKSLPSRLPGIGRGGASTGTIFFVSMYFAFELTPMGRAGRALNFEVVGV